MDSFWQDVKQGFRSLLKDGRFTLLATLTSRSVESMALYRPFVNDIDIDTAPARVRVWSVIGSALLASFMPARRAARVDPLVALRHE